MSTRSLPTATVSILFAASLVFAPAAAQEPASRPAAWPLVAKARAGKLRGLPEASGPVIRDLNVGEWLVVVGSQNQYYEIEVPGGVPAWIWAAYVRDGKEAGTVSTTDNGVNLRPEPKSDTRALPLARVNKGETFVQIGRQDGWVRVVAPPEVHAFVLASEVELTNDPPSARRAELEQAALWVAALRNEAIQQEAARKVEIERQRKEEEARKEIARREAEARALCAEAGDLLRGAPDAAHREKATALLAEAERRAKDLPPKSAETVNADVKRGRDRLDAIAFYEAERASELARAEREAKEAQRRADEAAARAQESLARHADPKPVDAFGSRFAGGGLGMGWLRRELEVPRGRVFKIEKGGRLLFYVTCPSGKYDLDDYLGREIGVIGAVKEVEGYPVRVVEVERIEVLS